MSKKGDDLGLDLITPLAEVLQAVMTLIFRGIKALVKLLWRKVLQVSPPLEKIERDQLRVKKKTKEGAFLGIDTKTKRGVMNLDINFKKHSFIVGASGFGKTNLITCLQDHTLKCDKPIIFFDPKGDLEALNSFKALCESWGRKCHVFSEHFKDSISLNPLRDGTINQVCDRIMSAFEWSEPYYQDCSRRDLNKVLRQIKEDEEPFTLKRIYDQLKDIESKENSGLVSKLESVLESDFGPILSRDDAMTFKEIRDERACLYIGLSTQGYPTTAKAVGKFFLGELLYNSYDALRNNSGAEALENPISVFFDEFGAIVTPEFIELQNKCRGAGIELTMAVQTASDINKIDPELTSQIVENAGNLFILKQRLDSAASYFADAIGTTLSKKKTHRIEEGEETTTGSEREVHENLVHPDIIKNLKIGQCVFLSQSPTRLMLLNLREAPKIEVEKGPLRINKTSNALA